MSERGMWGVQKDTRRISGQSGGISFVKRRIMHPNKVDVGGKFVSRWTGWYYVEAFDSYNGRPYGHYLCPPTYEDFSSLYKNTSSQEITDFKTLMLEYGDDIELNLKDHLGSGVSIASGTFDMVVL